MEEKRTVSHLTEVREWYERYFSEHGTWPTTAAYARTLLELVDPEPAPENGRALLVDVACGGGHFLSHVPPGLYHRVGIDLSLTAASEAGHRATTPTVVAAAEALPLRDGIVDLLVCLGSFEHFVDKEATCREFARVTRSLLWDDVTIGDGAVLHECIVADRVTIAGGARYERCAIVATESGLVVETL